MTSDWRKLVGSLDSHNNTEKSPKPFL